MQTEIKKLIEEIEDACGALAITHDAPDEEMILGWLKTHEEIIKS